MFRCAGSVKLNGIKIRSKRSHYGHHKQNFFGVQRTISGVTTTTFYAAAAIAHVSTPLSTFDRRPHTTVVIVAHRLRTLDPSLTPAPLRPFTIAQLELEENQFEIFVHDQKMNDIVAFLPARVVQKATSSYAESHPTMFKYYYVVRFRC